MARKEEHKTNLLGTTLVGKTHPRIAFRGQVDSLNAAIIRLETLAREAEKSDQKKDLEEIRQQVVKLFMSEVRGLPCEELTLWGLSEEEIRERSHFPEKFYGLGHVLPHPDMGRWAAELNLLRTRVREVELAACRAFEEGEETSRPDIVKVLNRLSSAFYILIYKYLPEGYDRLVHFARKK